MINEAVAERNFIVFLIQIIVRINDDVSRSTVGVRSSSNLSSPLGVRPYSREKENRKFKVGRHEVVSAIKNFVVLVTATFLECFDIRLHSSLCRFGAGKAAYIRFEQIGVRSVFHGCGLNSVTGGCASRNNGKQHFWHRKRLQKRKYD